MSDTLCGSENKKNSDKNSTIKMAMANVKGEKVMLKMISKSEQINKLDYNRFSSLLQATFSPTWGKIEYPVNDVVPSIRRD